MKTVSYFSSYKMKENELTKNREWLPEDQNRGWWITIGKEGFRAINRWLT